MNEHDDQFLGVFSPSLGPTALLLLFVNSELAREHSRMHGVKSRKERGRGWIKDEMTERQDILGQSRTKQKGG